MIKYEYKKVTGYEQKKFIENGHTMFEEDVLQRLKRLAYLEVQQKQANGVDKSTESCHIQNVSKRYLLEVITSKGNSLHCSVYDDCEKAQQMYGVLEHEWKGSTTRVKLTAFNAC